MVSLNNLKELSESSGMIGGFDIDDVSLDSAFVMAESYCSVIAKGETNAYAIMPIDEGVLETIVEKVKAFFRKIGEMLRSIATKIRNWFSGKGGSSSSDNKSGDKSNSSTGNSDSNKSSSGSSQSSSSSGSSSSNSNSGSGSSNSNSNSGSSNSNSKSSNTGVSNNDTLYCKFTISNAESYLAKVFENLEDVINASYKEEEPPRINGWSMDDVKSGDIEDPIALLKELADSAFQKTGSVEAATEAIRKSMPYFRRGTDQLVEITNNHVKYRTDKYGQKVFGDTSDMEYISKPKDQINRREVMGYTNNLESFGTVASQKLNELASEYDKYTGQVQGAANSLKSKYSDDYVTVVLEMMMAAMSFMTKPFLGGLKNIVTSAQAAHRMNAAAISRK